MATNETRPDARRLRYFNGLIMKEEEFVLEQNYHIRMRRLHNRHLHGRGIVWGLEVDLGNTTNEVLVRAGMALDNYFDLEYSEESSRELILTDDCEVDLSAYSPGDRIWLWLNYAEEQVEIVPDRGGQEPIHIKESAVINHSTDDPGDRDRNIVLAIVEFGPSGVVDLSAIKDNDNGELVRLTAAFKSDRLDTEVLTLRDAALPVGAEPAFLDGFVFENTGDIGIVVNSDRTRFTAAVDVDTDLTVEQATRLKGDVQLDQNLTVFGNLTVNQNATVAGDLAVDTNALVSGDADFSQDVTIVGNLRSGNISGALELDDDLHVAGSIQAASGTAISEFSTDTALAGDSDAAVPTERAVKSYVDARFTEYLSSELVGFVAAYSVNTPPAGWLECDGQAISRTTYANLFGRIGTSFGVGDGATTFNLPDLRGEFVRGWDHGRLVDSGRVFGSAQDDRFQGHHHIKTLFLTVAAGFPNFGGRYADGGDPFGTVLDPVTDGTNGTPRTGPETRPRNVALMYCIKY